MTKKAKLVKMLVERPDGKIVDVSADVVGSTVLLPDDWNIILTDGMTNFEFEMEITGTLNPADFARFLDWVSPFVGFQYRVWKLKQVVQDEIKKGIKRCRNIFAKFI